MENRFVAFDDEDQASETTPSLPGERFWNGLEDWLEAVYEEDLE
jgi:hypothetical protein